MFYKKCDLLNVIEEICKYKKVKFIQDEIIRITTLGGFREVGRMGMLIQTPESNVLIDCGINVGSPNNPFPYLNIPESLIETSALLYRKTVEKGLIRVEEVPEEYCLIHSKEEKDS